MYEDLSYTYGSGTYAIYLRKSRKDLDAEAMGEGETLSRHLDILKSLAKRMELNVVKIYAEVVSGESIDARPQMQELLRDVETGIYDGVLVVEVERLARGDTSDQGRVAKTFKFSNTLIITPSKTYDPNNEFDEEYFEFGLFMSRREYKTIRRRLVAGSDASRREGKYTGNVPPYGYARKKLKKEKGWTLEIIPDQAQVVRMIFDWYRNGMQGIPVGYTAISDELNRLSIPSPSGTRWTPNGIQGILRNPVYAGYIKSGYRKEVKKIVDGKLTRSRPLNNDYTLYPGRHESIISQETWDAVHNRMLKRVLPSSSSRVKPQQNPLAGLVCCSQCGRIMQRRPYQSGRTATLICPTKGCSTVASDLSMVEQRLLDALDQWLVSGTLPDPDHLPDNSDRLDLLRQAVSSCSEDLSEADRQLQKQYDLLEKGIYDEVTFFERSAIMKKRKSELTSRLKDLQTELQTETERNEAVKNLLPTLQTIHDTYPKLTSAELKNRLLKEVIDHVEYSKSENGRWGHPYNFSLKIYPRVTPA